MSVSNVPRSRSPAVKSMAGYTAPVTVISTRIKGINAANENTGAPEKLSAGLTSAKTVVDTYDTLRGSRAARELKALEDRKKRLEAEVAAKGYGGYMSFEAPNPAAWSRAPQDVAREALEATRTVLPRR